MAQDFFDNLEETLSATGKVVADKAKEVASTAKRHNDIRVAKKQLRDLYEQVGKLYWESNKDYPQADYIDLFNLIEKLLGDIEILEKEGQEDPVDDFNQEDKDEETATASTEE